MVYTPVEKEKPLAQIDEEDAINYLKRRKKYLLSELEFIEILLKLLEKE